jgi:hypothetical protein
MAIDWSTNTSEWWKTSFEKYFTIGGVLDTIIQSEGLEGHYNSCLPEGDFPDKEFETTDSQWRITATHNGAGERFELVVDRASSEWEFNWLG